MLVDLPLEPNLQGDHHVFILFLPCLHLKGQQAIWADQGSFLSPETCTKSKEHETDSVLHLNLTCLTRRGPLISLRHTEHWQYQLQGQCLILSLYHTHPEVRPHHESAEPLPKGVTT